MTAAKHTPGEWHTSDVGRGLVIYDESGWAVADAKVFHSRRTMGEALANARLIAAAPDLLVVANDFKEALAELGPSCECGQPDCRTTRLRAAIAKAAGQEGGAA